MIWKCKDIDTDEIKLAARPRSKYKELYDKIFLLKVGKGIEVECETAREAANIRNTVSGMLKKKGLSDKYIASNRLNKFYCGRLK